MDTLHVRYGMWAARYASHLIVLRTVASIAGYANLHATAIAQIALR